MNSRARIAADAVGSVRAEGLEPGTTVIGLLERWASGAIRTDELGDAAHRLAAGRSVADMLAQREAA